MAAEQLGTLQPDGMTVGTSSVPYELAYDKTALAIYTTCDSTDTDSSWVPVLFNSAITGTGQVGGRVHCYLSITSAAGDWTNALKSEVVYGTSGSTSGLGSAFCAEMTLTAGCSAGNYALFEGELNMGTAGVTGTCTSLIYLSVNDTAKTTFQTNGYILNLQGLGDATSGEVFDTCVATPASHALRILIGSTPYYILLTNNVDDT